MTLRQDSEPGPLTPGEPAAGTPGAGVSAASAEAADTPTPGPPTAGPPTAGIGQQRMPRVRARGALAAAVGIVVVAVIGLAGLTAFVLASHPRPHPARSALPAVFR